MITIDIPESEFYNEELNEFIEVKAITLELEHSLISVSKWESKWKKPYISETEKTTEEVIDYINDPMTATTFYDFGKKPARSSEYVTSELIYYWMTAYNIPFTCEKWNFNRLMTLIRVAGEKNNPEQEKMSPDAIREQNRMLNEKRRAAMKSKG